MKKEVKKYCYSNRLVDDWNKLSEETENKQNTEI